MTKASKRNDENGSELTYGPVIVLSGPQKGRIGEYDDDASIDTAVVYFGHPLMVGAWIEVDRKSLRPANTNDLYERMQDLQNVIMRSQHGVSVVDVEPLLFELEYVQTILVDHMMHQKYRQPTDNPKKIFLAHSSKDKGFVRRVADDLIQIGHDVWLDELKIIVGDSIPLGIQEGLESCDCMIVFLSKNSEASNWFNREWTAFLMRQMESTGLRIIPSLIEKCEVPKLLKSLRWVNFEKDYEQALTNILIAIAQSPVSAQSLSKNV